MITAKRFQASWCQPCRISEPIYETFIWDNGIQSETVDIDGEPDVAEKYSVMTIPTVIFEREGEEIARLVGPQTSVQLKQAYDNL